MPQQLRVLPWYDRNPTSILKVYNGSVKLPHALTIRWGYRVPSRKKAFMESLEMKVQRDTVATTPRYSDALVYYTPYDGLTITLFWVRLPKANVVGEQDDLNIGHSLTMLEGDLIEAFTQDSSEDGAVNYHVTAKITEFDAIMLGDIEVLPPIQTPKEDIQEPKKPWWWPF